ncbi:MAG: lysophospholipid acyltransferase family protein [Chloroflexia bacterium]
MLTYYGLRIGVVLAAIIPRRLAYWFCSVIGNIAFFGNGPARRATQDNMRHVLGPDAEGRRLNKVCRAIFRNAVKNYYELLCLPGLSEADLKKRVRAVGREHIDNALKGGRGVIIFSGHIGNFNLVAQMARFYGWPANIVAEQMAPPKLHEFMNGLRSRFGLKLIPLGPAAVKGIYHALRSNEVIGLAADRDLTSSGVPVEFFGEVTELPSGLAALSLRLKAPLLPVHVVRKANDSSVVTIYPPLQFARTGDRELDTLLGTQQIAHVVEEMIRKTPEQWVVLQHVWPDDGATEPCPETTLRLPTADLRPPVHDTRPPSPDAS